MIINLDTISYVRIYPPKEIKLEFPEIRTAIKRRTETKWVCLIYYGNGEIKISGEEAVSFIELLSPSIRELKVKEEETFNKEED